MSDPDNGMVATIIRGKRATAVDLRKTAQKMEAAAQLRNSAQRMRAAALLQKSAQSMEEEAAALEAKLKAAMKGVKSNGPRTDSR